MSSDKCMCFIGNKKKKEKRKQKKHPNKQKRAGGGKARHDINPPWN